MGEDIGLRYGATYNDPRIDPTPILEAPPPLRINGPIRAVTSFPDAPVFAGPISVGADTGCSNSLFRVTGNQHITGAIGVGICPTGSGPNIQLAGPVQPDSDNAAGRTIGVKGSLRFFGGYFGTEVLIGVSSANMISLIPDSGAGKIIPPSTSISFRNNADTHDNVLINDAGLVSLGNSFGPIFTPALLAATWTNATGSNQNIAVLQFKQTVAVGTAETMEVVVEAAHTSGTVTQLKGVTAITEVTGAGGTTTAAYALYAAGVLSAGTLTTYAGLRSSAAVTGTAVTDAYAFYAPSMTVAGGSITNAYGLVIDNVTVGGTLNKAIKTGLGLVDFGDKLAVASTVGIMGAVPSSSIGLFLGSAGAALTGSTTQTGMNIVAVGDSGGTTTLRALALTATTATAAYTVTTAQGIRIFDATLGVGSTITTLVGIEISPQTKGGTNMAIRHGDPVLLHTSVALTNGAGAGAGTLTNAPSAGNPSKWVPIDDNGTTRYLPAW